MAVVQALRQSPGALARTPALVVPAVVLFLLQLPQMALQSVDPLVASVVSLGLSGVFVLVVPLFQAGMVGMADEALDGRSSLSAFLSHGTANYVQVLVAYLLLVAANFVLGGALFAVGIAALVSGALSDGTAALAALGVVATLVAIAYLLVAFFVQFYAQAIVIDGCGAVDGLKRSYGIVRSNLLPTAGYTGLAAVFGGLFGLVFGGFAALTTPEVAATYGLPELSTPGVVGGWLALTAFGAAFSTLLLVFSVAFYRLVRD